MHKVLLKLHCYVFCTVDALTCIYNLGGIYIFNDDQPSESDQALSLITF